MQTIPFFKSHWSIGKSILTIDPPSKQVDGGADSIVSIAKENDLKEVYLVEDSLAGLPNAHKSFSKENIKLNFGLRITICDDMHHKTIIKTKDILDAKQRTENKIILFAKNDNGIKSLISVFSKAWSENGKIDYKTLKEDFNSDDLVLVVPFYDSYIFNNLLKFSNCVPDFPDTKIFYCIEDNLLPFDSVVKSRIEKIAPKDSIINCKSIYYKNRKDFEAFMTYKLICGRQGFSNSKMSINVPNLDHMGSKEFCYEAMG